MSAQTAAMAGPRQPESRATRDREHARSGSAPDDSIRRKAVLRMLGVPRDQTPGKNAPGRRPGDQEPDHGRQADDNDEHATHHENDPADIADDFHGREVDLRRP